MQLLYPKPLVNQNMMNGHMIIHNQQMFAKYGQQVGYALPMMSPRMHGLHMEGRPRRRRNNHSLVATMDPVAVARRNERERNRVKQVNDGFDALRKKVPFLPEKKKLSKVEILRYAMMYIRDLKGIVEEYDCNNIDTRTSPEYECIDQKISEYDDCCAIDNQLNSEYDCNDINDRKTSESSCDGSIDEQFEGNISG